MRTQPHNPDRPTVEKIITFFFFKKPLKLTSVAKKMPNMCPQSQSACHVAISIGIWSCLNSNPSLKMNLHNQIPRLHFLKYYYYIIFAKNLLEMHSKKVRMWEEGVSFYYMSTFIANLSGCRHSYNSNYNAIAICSIVYFPNSISTPKDSPMK